MPYLSSSSQSVTRLTDANVQAEFADFQVAHDILRLVFAGSLSCSWGSFRLKRKIREKNYFNVCESIIASFCDIFA